ncbi:MAG: C45 family autoproteolytic acyltransferase/hydrolase [Ktedonobacteraceae bacterium]
MDRHIPLVISTGDPFTRGFHLGSSEKERVKHTITAYMGIFAQTSGLHHEAVLSHAERFMPSIAQYAPHLLDEMRGIAQGAGRDIREIVAINVRTELMYGVTRQLECTSIGINENASTDGHIRVAQNWDWRSTLRGTLILWALQPEEGHDVFTLTEAGMVGKIGINSSGLAMCINLLKSDTDHAGPAVPMHIILRRVLEDAHSVEEAVTLIKETDRCTSCFHMLVDRRGALAGVEATPAGQYVLRSASGVLTHANHCTSPELFIHDSNAREFPETLARGEHAQTLASKQKIDVHFLQSILTDHKTAPGSICLHVEPDIPLIENYESIASIIFDLTAGTVDIAEGPPCKNAYRCLLLEDCLRVTSYRQTGY